MDYDPGARLTAAQALSHPFFDELREPTTALPEGHVLFEMTDEECEHLKKVSNGQDLIRRILPAARFHHEPVEGIKKRTYS
jgi:hypothetical protein